MKAKSLTLQVEFVVKKAETHNTRVDLDIPNDYNIQEFNIEDFKEEILEQMENSYWSGYSVCHDEETTNIIPLWD